MSDIKDGGPAFPSTNANEPSINGVRGISLRDYFAAAAMQGMLSDYGSNYAPKTDKSDERDWRDDYAIVSYEIADAMLSARSK